jgi:hypothetical protein
MNETEKLLLREHLIDFADWLSNQAEIDVMVVDEAVDQYLAEQERQALL